MLTGGDRTALDGLHHDAGVGEPCFERRLVADVRCLSFHHANTVSVGCDTFELPVTSRKSQGASHERQVPA